MCGLARLRKEKKCFEFGGDPQFTCPNFEILKFEFVLMFLLTKNYYLETSNLFANGVQKYLESLIQNSLKGFSKLMKFDFQINSDYSISSEFLWEDSTNEIYLLWNLKD